MAERAHPDDPGFGERWCVQLIGGLIPVPVRQRNPYREALFWRYKVVARHCRGKDLLDVPCGMVWGTSLLKGCRSIVGIDIASEAIAEARSRYGHRAEFRTGDMGALDIPDSSIDVVSCLEGIEHVPPATDASFVRECYRVLRAGGLVILSSPHCNDAPHSGNPYHIKEYRPEEMRALVTPLFEVVEETRRIVDNLTITMFVLRRRAAVTRGLQLESAS